MPMPRKTLRGGIKMPLLGLGTFGSDRYGPDEVAGAVREGIGLGYRLIDCAAVYGNEAQVGQALHDAQCGGISREDLFVVSKVWNDSHGQGDVLLSCARSLKELRLEYLDLFLVHWPFRNFHPKGAPPDYHDGSARPFDPEQYLQTWYQMERLQKAGYVRAIGTSNMSIAKLDFLLKNCTILPSANEMELHPSFQQPELFGYCVERGIQPVGFSPLGSPSRPERDRMSDDIVDMEEPVILELACKHQLHPAQVCLKWAIQRGQIPIAFSVKPRQLASNLQAVFAPDFSDGEMRELEKTDRGCRLIKGQVFLWDGAKDWTQLWDPDGSQINWSKNSKD